MWMLRTTRSSTGWLLRGIGYGCIVALGIGGLSLALSGCGSANIEAVDAASESDAPTATDRPLMSRLPPPRAEWIDYSPKERKLTLYELPASGRWMVKLPESTTAYSVGPEHVLPEGLDPDYTEVFYMRPGGQASRSVTLAQIQAAGRDHMSINFPR